MNSTISAARTLTGGAALAAMLAFAGCDAFSSDPSAGTLNLVLSTTADGHGVVINTSTHTSPAGHEYSVSLLEYLVTSVTLHGADGTDVILAAAHYCNDADPLTHEVTVSDVPPGRYTGLSFKFGVAGAANEFGTLERTTDIDNMMWPAMAPMGDGTTSRYHYMRFEGHFGTGGAFRIHVGPSGGNDFSFDVALPTDIQVDGNETDVSLVMDVNEWLGNPNVWDFSDYGMIMGNQAAQALLQENGASVFSIGHILQR